MLHSKKKWVYVGFALLIVVTFSVFAKDNDTKPLSFSEMNETQCREWLESHGVVYPSNADRVDWDRMALESARLLEKNLKYPSFYNYTVAADFFEDIRQAITQAENRGISTSDVIPIARTVLQDNVALGNWS